MTHDPKDPRGTVAELRALLDKATPGPMRADDTMIVTEDPGFMGREEDIVAEDVVRPEDAELFAALRNAAPKLLAVVEAAQAVVERRGSAFEMADVRDALAALEAHR